MMSSDFHTDSGEPELTFDALRKHIEEEGRLERQAALELAIAKRRAYRCKLHKLNPKINATLLHLIREKIRLSPEEFDMNRWQTLFYKDDAGNRQAIEYTSYANNQEELKFACGTAACIAGWAVKIGDTKTKPLTLLHIDKGWHGAISTRAQEFLGLTSVQAASLFYTQYWEDGLPSGTKRNTPEAAIRYLNMILAGKVPLFNSPKEVTNDQAD